MTCVTNETLLFLVKKPTDVLNSYFIGITTLHVSVVGIAAAYRLDGPGIESRRWRDFPHLFRPARGPPSLLYNGYRVFPAGKVRPERDADPSPPSSAEVKIE